MTSRKTEINAAFAPDPAKSVMIPLASPLKRDGGVDIDQITLRKPNAGELRGLKVPDLINGDVNTIITLLPRISSPVVSVHEAEKLDVEDLAEIAGAVVGFFMNQAARAQIEKMMGG
ncbi:phage tail assembly protein [Novosphingobium pituita]|uniref:Phage tail assembly protein n=1 Tax=Novosphingobium pituita TaxID=3056842 RepID=A0ABQ6P4X9_9SPHN|nr:phage tail assembly protein [Novosphingobium sp. IK01]GMM59851.1 phage tail assembly protein [Novosphingobium sp. IK01]